MKAMLLVVAAVLAVGTIAILGTGVSVYNTCIGMEAGIEAQYKQNQNNYDNFFKSVVETAQVTDKYAADLKKVFDGAMTGRYGSGGSKATWAWLQENNPKLDASLYTKIQQIIESGRANFETNQKLLIDKKQVYQVHISEFPGNLYARVLGFPKLNLSKYDIVTSNETTEAFETKKSAPLKF